MLKHPTPHSDFRSFLFRIFVTKYWIKLNPCHVSGGDIGDVASGTFGHGRFSRSLLIRQRIMAEGKKAPAVRLRKPLAVLDGKVNPVVLAVEKSATGWFFTRSVGKSWIKNASQLFYNDRSFGKRTRLQIGVNVFLLNVDVMIFGKVRLSVVETIGR